MGPAAADKWVPIVDEAKAKAKGRRYSDSGVLSVDQVHWRCPVPGACT